jgi:hypothetical protein
MTTVEGLLIIPQDHKNLIYYFLSINDLVNLSETCKTFYRDENRKEFIQRKLVDSCFYSSPPLLKESHFHMFPNIINIYFQYLKTLQMKEIKYPIPFFINPFLSLDPNERHQIVQSIFKSYGYYYFKYIEEQNMETLSHCEVLFISIENILKEIFINDEDDIRKRVLDEFSFFNKFINNINVYYHNITLTESFLFSLNLKYWKDLEKIIQIANVLEIYDQDSLYEFLYELFQPFIDYQNMNSIKEDKYVESFENKLEQIYHISPKKIYKDRLFELFTSCHYMIHQEFEWAIEFRLDRLDSIDEEDFDY